jgi:hypothetical protein
VETKEVLRKLGDEFAFHLRFARIAEAGRDSVDGLPFGQASREVGARGAILLEDVSFGRAKQGAPVFYAAEVVDGEVREFGRAPSGQRVILMGGQLHWPARKPGGNACS